MHMHIKRDIKRYSLKSFVSKAKGEKKEYNVETQNKPEHREICINKTQNRFMVMKMNKLNLHV